MMTNHSYWLSEATGNFDQQFLTLTRNPLKQSRKIDIGSQVGTKGGEGAAFQIIGDPQTLVKIYHSGKAADRHEKVAAMVASGLHSKLSFAAMPQQLVVDDNGQFAGFTMQRVQQAFPIHQLYNRDNRVQYFPDADYRFMVRAAHNLAQAFMHLHYENLMVGDVNESGIFYSTGGWVKLIDCDSFQAELGNKSYPCLVKVPQYTPAELHGVQLSKIKRTPNHDNFALAVMIFRLLMLGQHPFTAQYKGTGDAPTVGSRIKNFEYVYERNLKGKNYAPPPHALDINTLPDPIISAFETAFGGQGPNGRPTAADWSAMLQSFDHDLVGCTINPSHQYLSIFSTCPLCGLENKLSTQFFAPQSAYNHQPRHAQQPQPHPNPGSYATQIPNSQSNTGRRGVLARLFGTAMAGIAVVAVGGYLLLQFDKFSSSETASSSTPQASTGPKAKTTVESKTTEPKRKTPEQIELDRIRTENQRLEEARLERTKQLNETWHHVRLARGKSRKIGNVTAREFFSNARTRMSVTNQGEMLFCSDAYEYQAEDENGLYTSQAVSLSLSKYREDGTFAWEMEFPDLKGLIYSCSKLNTYLYLINITAPGGLQQSYIYNYRNGEAVKLEGNLRRLNYILDKNAKKIVSSGLHVDSKRIEISEGLSKNVGTAYGVILQEHDVDTGKILSSKKTVVWRRPQDGKGSPYIESKQLQNGKFVAIVPTNGSRFVELTQGFGEYSLILFDHDGKISDTIKLVGENKKNEAILPSKIFVNVDGDVEVFGTRSYGDKGNILDQMFYAKVDLSESIPAARVKYFGKAQNTPGSHERQGRRLFRVAESFPNYYVETFIPSFHDERRNPTSWIFNPLDFSFKRLGSTDFSKEPSTYSSSRGFWAVEHLRYGSNQIIQVLKFEGNNDINTTLKEHFSKFR
ncbi:hypothetical protein ABVF61_19155 [Roseibium sp. HPY-6]|uniref:helix-hairpin-helix domain-containing protein n=1 Tax=Roseibium sp. HPY-6 TaxID=3229852 RepID=UPI00338FE135